MNDTAGEPLAPIGWAYAWPTMSSYPAAGNPVGKSSRRVWIVICKGVVQHGFDELAEHG
jgi:hypothetical protein